MAQSYYITSRAQWSTANPAEPLLAKVRDALAAGVDFVQLREKGLSVPRLLELTQACVRMRAAGASRLLVNTRADVALAAGADGVHLPFANLPLAALRRRRSQLQIAGVSCHNEQEAAEAAAAQADYLLLGPVFPTPSKPGAAPLGLKRFAKICAQVSIPVFALGGVDRGNARDCVAAGARGIAGIRLFQRETDLPRLVAELRALQRPEDTP